MILCVPRYMLKSSQTTKAFDCLTQNNGIIFQQSKQHDVAIMYCNIAVFGFNSYLQFVYMFIPQCSGIIKCERLRTNGFYLRQIYGYKTAVWVVAYAFVQSVHYLQIVSDDYKYIE